MFTGTALTSWFENEFLDAPVQEFGDVQLVRGGTSNFVNPSELAGLFAGFAEDAEDSSIKRKFVDAAGKSVGSIEDLIWSGRDAESPGRAGRHRASCGRRFVADGGAGVGGRGNIDCELAEKLSVGIENLDAAVAAVGDINVVLRIDGDAVRDVELAGLIAGFAPGLEPIAVLIDLGDA